MTKFFLSFLLTFPVFYVTAQFTTNVYWVEQTTMNPSNTIYYHPEQPLVWSNFTGKPASGGITAAMTSSGFGYKANMQNKNGKGEINISVYCYFIKDKSWVKAGRTTDYILNHEQHHFDVSYLAAGLFIEKIKKAGLTSANCNTLLPKIYNECTDFMTKTQDEYDGQTHNGQLPEIQKKWNNYFGEKVPLVTR